MGSNGPMRRTGTITGEGIRLLGPDLEALPALLPAAEKAGAEYFLIEQDDTYGRDPIDCIRESREYLRSIGY